MSWIIVTDFKKFIYQVQHHDDQDVRYAALEALIQGWKSSPETLSIIKHFYFLLLGENE
jgi:hypothetical protein